MKLGSVSRVVLSTLAGIIIVLVVVELTACFKLPLQYAATIGFFAGLTGLAATYIVVLLLWHRYCEKLAAACRQFARRLTPGQTKPPRP